MVNHQEWHEATRWCHTILWASFMRDRDSFGPAPTELKYARDILEEALKDVAELHDYAVDHSFRGPCSICSEEYDKFVSRWSCMLCGRNKANIRLGDVNLSHKFCAGRMPEVCRDCLVDRSEECKTISKELNNGTYTGSFSKCDGKEYP